MEKKRFLDFLDMFDGGGAGQMGDKFEGGGLLSMLGNALGSPYGSEDPERRAARQAFYGSDQIGGGPMAMPNQSQVMPQQDNYTVDAFEPNYADRFGVPETMPPMQYGPPARALVGPQLRAALGILPAPVSATEQSPMEMFGGMGPAAYSPPEQVPPHQLDGMTPAPYRGIDEAPMQLEEFAWSFVNALRDANSGVRQPIKREDIINAYQHYLAGGVPADQGAPVREIEAYLRRTGNPSY